MNIYTDIPSPHRRKPALAASDYGLQNHGLSNLRRVYWNLPTARCTKRPSSAARAASPTRGRSWSTPASTRRARPRTSTWCASTSSEDYIWWGQYNRPFHPRELQHAAGRVQAYLQGRDVFVQDCFAGADPDYRMPVRIITEKAWHSLFARNMFIKPADAGRVQEAHSGVHRHRRAVVQRQPADRRHAHGDVHHPQLRPAAGHHRRHPLRRRDQEDHLHRAELPAAA